MLIVRDRSRILLVPDPLDGGGTLAPPTAVVREGASSRRVALALARAHGADAESHEASRTFRHQTYSHHYTIEVWEAHRRTGLGRTESHQRWSLRSDFARLPLRATTLKAIKDL